MTIRGPLPRLMAWSLFLVGCGGQDASEAGGVIDDAVLRQAGEDAANWVMYGRTSERP